MKNHRKCYIVNTFQGHRKLPKSGGAKPKILKSGGQNLIFCTVEIDFLQKVGGQLPPLPPVSYAPGYNFYKKGYKDESYNREMDEKVTKGKKRNRRNRLQANQMEPQMHPKSEGGCRSAR